MKEKMLYATKLQLLRLRYLRGWLHLYTIYNEDTYIFPKATYTGPHRAPQSRGTRCSGFTIAWLSFLSFLAQVTFVSTLQFWDDVNGPWDARGSRWAWWALHGNTGQALVGEKESINMVVKLLGNFPTAISQWPVIQLNFTKSIICMTKTILMTRSCKYEESHRI